MGRQIYLECETNDVLEHAQNWEHMTCEHEWPLAADTEEAQIITDVKRKTFMNYDIFCRRITSVSYIT